MNPHRYNPISQILRTRRIRERWRNYPSTSWLWHCVLSMISISSLRDDKMNYWLQKPRNNDNKNLINCLWRNIWKIPEEIVLRKEVDPKMPKNIRVGEKYCYCEDTWNEHCPSESEIFCKKWEKIKHRKSWDNIPESIIRMVRCLLDCSTIKINPKEGKYTHDWKRYYQCSELIWCFCHFWNNHDNKRGDAIF